jgi:hypothetical protein
MRELESTLGEARRLFTKARSQSKRYDKEAAAWIQLLDHMLDRLRRRIAGDPQPPERVGASPTPMARGAMSAPPRPVPPVSGSGAPDAMKPGTDTPPRRATPQAPPDAGVSGGGILL